MLKFENRAEITEYDANGQAGLVENDVFAKTLRMLADALYKCLKNVENDCHPHCQSLENGLHMSRTLTNAITNNANALQTPYK